MNNPRSYATYRGGPPPKVRFFDDFFVAGFLTNTAGAGGKLDETADVADWLVTVIDGGGDNGETISVIDAGKGGWLKLLTNDANDDAVAIQLNGESFKPSTDLSYETVLKITDVSETDFIFGLGISDTEPLGSIDTDGANPGLSDFIGFVCPDSSGNVYALTILNGVAAITDTGVDLADGTKNRFRFEYSVAKAAVEFMIDGILVAEHSTYIPTDQSLSPLYMVRNDGAVVQSMLIDYIAIEQDRDD